MKPLILLFEHTILSRDLMVPLKFLEKDSFECMNLQWKNLPKPMHWTKLLLVLQVCNLLVLLKRLLERYWKGQRREVRNQVEMLDMSIFSVKKSPVGNTLSG